MELATRHRFATAPDRVAAAMVDPTFVPELVKILDVGAAEVVEAGHDSTSSWLSTRLTYDGSLDPIAAQVLGSKHPSWVQTYRIDASEVTGQLTIEPDHHASLISCWADIALTATDGGSERSIRGELKVRVPLLGGKAERALVPAIAARIDAEAALLDGWLTRS
ncbi:MAG: DUF2505 domain-containing protein [Acidimicrobiales bacterium]|nr:DUF2505 domain-containing protein [Acidimicrobiales bacterium]